MTLVPLTDKEYREHVENERSRRGHVTAVDSESGPRPKFLNTIIKYYGQDPADSSTEIVTNCINTFVENVLEGVQSASKDDDFAELFGELHEVGSAAEEVKVGLPNEFDFVLVLSKSHEWIRSIDDIEYVIPETFKPRGSKGVGLVYERSFFRISFGGHDRVPEEWTVCMKCRNCLTASGCTHEEKYLSPRSVQSRFRVLVERVITQMMGRNGINTEVARVTCGGPAITCYTKICLPDNRSLIVTIDITLAFQINRSADPWPIGKYRHIQLEETANDLDYCLLVPSGDFWRLSFVLTEKARMISLPARDKTCLRALKSMRDELTMTDEYESPILTSYPLKVAFLKQVRETSHHHTIHHHSDEEATVEWKRKDYSRRVIDMLSSVEKEGIETGQKSLYVHNDTVCPGGEGRAYFETRRIIHHLDEMTDLYYGHGGLHILLLSLIFIVTTILISLSIKFLASPAETCIQSLNLTDHGHHDNSSHTDYVCLIWYSPLHMFFSSFLFLLPLFGICTVCTSTASQVVLYKIYKDLRWIYIALFITGFTHFVLSVLILHYYFKFDHNVGYWFAVRRSATSIHRFCYASVGLCASVILLFIVHMIHVCAHYVKKHGCSGRKRSSGYRYNDLTGSINTVDYSSLSSSDCIPHDNTMYIAKSNTRRCIRTMYRFIPCVLFECRETYCCTEG